MNIFDEHAFKVILDYAHNPAAVKAMCDLVERFEPDGRRIVVLAAPGDRRDEDITEIATIAAPHFDHFICRRDDNLRGRHGDEVPLLQKRALEAAGIGGDRIEIVPDEQDAVNHALSIAGQGDLVLVLGDDITRCWKQIIYFDAGSRDSERAPSKTTAPPLPDMPEFSFDEELELIQDERGVRLAREAGD